MSRSFAVTAAVLFLFVGSACDAPAPPKKTIRPRPVRVLELRSVDPVEPLLLTGAVQAWKEEDVAFEVDGRVEAIVESGTNLEGRWVEGDKVRVEGQPIARLDPRSYASARDTAAALRDVAVEQLKVAKIELEQVLPANLRAAEAERLRAQAEFQRFEEALKTEAVAEVDVIRARADRDARQANYEQSQAAIETKKAELESLKAQIKEAQSKLVEAVYDVERCTLWAPFTGEVSQVHLEAGGYAQRGNVVAHLVMMDPIKVDIAVSATTAAQLRVRDPASLMLPGEKEPHLGAVYEKATVADAETRTFRVSVITRNRRVMRGVTDPSLEGLPRISSYFGLIKIDQDSSTYYVEERQALHRDEQGDFLWADPTSDRRKAIDPKRPVIKLEKIRVKLGEKRANYQGIYLLREVTDFGSLKPENIIAGPVPKGFAGGEVLVARRAWRLSPGQLVQLLLSPTRPAPGLYLPINAILPAGEKRGTVFLVENGQVRPVPIRITAQVGDRFQVAATDAADQSAIAPGAQVILDYLHFLRAGEPVNVTNIEEMRP